MASVNRVTCSKCSGEFERLKKQVNQVIRRSGSWSCKPCVLRERNVRNARPVGATRTIARSGYIEEKTDHGWRRQHILVIERDIGRRLKPDEVVHHKNEDPADNRRENLVLMKSADHTALHHIGSKRSPEKSARIRDACRLRRTTKLTPEAADMIRQQAGKGGVSQNAMARLLGVSPMTVSRVVNNQTWI